MHITRSTGKSEYCYVKTPSVPLIGESFSKIEVLYKG